MKCKVISKAYLMIDSDDADRTDLALLEDVTHEAMCRKCQEPQEHLSQN